MPDDVQVIKRVSPSRADRPAFGTEAYDVLCALRDQFERNGFVHIPALSMALLAGHADMRPLLAAAEDLPVDPFGDGLRRRLYSTAFFYPWTGDLRFDPPFPSANGSYVPYFQERSLNGDQGGRERRFRPLSQELENDPLLRALVSTHFHLIPGGAIEPRLPIRVGIHLIRLWSDGREACVPSPNVQHVDGEPFTSIILIDRVNVTQNSARNVIAKRRCAGLHMQDIAKDDRLHEATLTEPLESLYCDDARVSHGVNGVLGANESEGWRTSLLIDFSDIRLVRTATPHTPHGA